MTRPARVSSAWLKDVAQSDAVRALVDDFAESTVRPRAESLISREGVPRLDVSLEQTTTEREKQGFRRRKVMLRIEKRSGWPTAREREAAQTIRAQLAAEFHNRS